MAGPGPQDSRNAREGRMVALVIAATMILWMGAGWAGARFGWDTRYVFLADLAAIGAFLWALIVTWGIWRRQTAGKK
jgi:hypothetical protein